MTISLTSHKLAGLLPAAAFFIAGGLSAQSTVPKPSSGTRPPADLAQLMKGIIYPSANVFFAAQTDDPAQIKPDSKPSVSPNLLTSTFGKWEGVENSALALAESAALLMAPDRKCSSGRDVPLQNPDWEKLVNELREAGLLAYKAAASRNQDNVLQAADAVTAACSNCHGKYREGARRCR